MIETTTDYPSTPVYPLDSAAAKELADETGYATLTIRLEKHLFFDALIKGHGDLTLFTIEDFVHDRVLSIGATCDSNVEAVAIDGESITVEYRTSITAALTQPKYTRNEKRVAELMGVKVMKVRAATMALYGRTYDAEFKSRSPKKNYRVTCALEREIYSHIEQGARR